MLNDPARAIGSSAEIDSIMETVIRRSLRTVDAEQAAITLVNEHAEEPMKTLVRTMASSRAHNHFRLDQSLLGWVLRNRKPFSSNNLDQDHRLRGVKWDSSITSVLCVPLRVKSELEGVLAVYSKKGKDGFTTDDQRLLSIIAAQSAQVIGNARPYEEEKKKMELEQQLYRWDYRSGTWRSRDVWRGTDVFDIEVQYLLSADEILCRILVEVNRFCQGQEQSDDRTLVVLKVAECSFTT